MRLSDLNKGEEGIVIKVLGHGAFRKRIMEMGFVKGRKVKSLLEAPLNDPIKYSIMGYEVSLRRSEARLVVIVPVDESHADTTKPPTADQISQTSDFLPDIESHINDDHKVHGSRAINVALIGNPNCGKTSLFNKFSGAKERVGNYSGVTVDAITGHVDYKGYHINIVDLPGTYSLSCYSPEELYVRQYIHNESPDVIINVVDSSNLERNLYLATELIDMDRSMVIALNMYDELIARKAKLDYKELGNMIGVPMVPIVAKTGQGVDNLFDTVISVYEGQDPAVRHIHITLGHDVEAMVRQLIDAIKANGNSDWQFSPRYLAIKLLEGDKSITQEIESTPGGTEIIDLRDKLRRNYESLHGPDCDLQSAIADARYGFIDGALAETFQDGEKETLKTTRIIDAFVTNKLFGFPLFFLIMFAVFWATFAIGSYPMDWIEQLVAWIGGICSTHMPSGILKDLVVDGIIGGVGGVIVFLPNILILYYCISFMEDSGYMARAAFIMDKVMHRIGVHGKSFIPLIMGFGCNVPAIMASRTIESRSSRIITILINPFMSCSARLPVIVLLVGTFFPAHPALTFIGLYLAGIVVAVFTARMLRRFWFKTDETPFVMELPPYRIPTLKASLRHTWAKGEQYLKKMGGIILVASIVVWALNYFPKGSIDSAEQLTTNTEQQTPNTEHRDSYLETAGKFLNPVMEPIGFHWRATVAALAGIPAKEIVVSTLGVLYANDAEAEGENLGAKLAEVNPTTGKPDFTAAGALSFLVFIILYCPCIATVTAIARECGSWRYGAFSVIYNTLIAWLIAFATYHLALLF